MDATFLTKKVNVDGKNISLNIWDTAGQERYHALNAVYYREASGALIVYDVTDLDSFAKVKIWALELVKYLGEETPIIIAGNKSDVTLRTVPLADAEAYADEHGFTHSGTSAKTGHNVEETFLLLT
jgi:Ras-related protein Rab-21